jgi:hypothetical protein
MLVINKMEKKQSYHLPTLDPYYDMVDEFKRV